MFRTNLPGRSILHITLAFAITAPAFCQTSSSTQPPSPDSGDMRSDVPTTTLPETPQPQQSDVTLKSLPLHLLQDQRSIYTSPAHIRTHDLLWLLPTGAAVGAAFATDLHTMSTVVSKDASFNKNNIDASNVLTGVVLGVPAVLYGLGAAKNDEHARETGLLAGEAVGDGVVFEEVLKLTTWRERPYQGTGRGSFFQRDAATDSSFPSSHSTLVWASAAVLAGENSSTFAKFGIYTLATGVSVTRVLGQQHFPSDVLVGSAAGWLIGHYVYRTRHRH